MIVTQVTYGSAAHLAGLRIGDRIYEAGGQTFADDTELLKRLNSSPSPVRILVERNGQLREAALQVPELTSGSGR